MTAIISYLSLVGGIVIGLALGALLRAGDDE
jgi:hypothetical protein